MHLWRPVLIDLSQADTLLPLCIPPRSGKFKGQQMQVSSCQECANYFLFTFTTLTSWSFSIFCRVPQYWHQYGSSWLTLFLNKYFWTKIVILVSHKNAVGANCHTCPLACDWSFGATATISGWDNVMPGSQSKEVQMQKWGNLGASVSSVKYLWTLQKKLDVLNFRDTVNWDQEASLISLSRPGSVSPNFKIV